MEKENLSATPLRAPKRGGRSITILVARDVLNRFEEDLPLAKQLVNDFAMRDDYGYDKYYQNLESNDGRPTIWDFYQEMLDGCQYMRKLIEEGKMPARMASVYPTLLEIVKITRVSIDNEQEGKGALDWSATDEGKNSRDAFCERTTNPKRTLINLLRGVQLTGDSERSI